MKFRLILFSAVLLSTGCNSANIRNIADIANADDPVKQAGRVLEQKGRDIASNPAALPAEIKKLKTRIAKFKKLIDAIWGEEDAPEAGPKDYVKYTDQYYNRAHIDFEAGLVTVETIAPEKQRDYLKKAIVTTLLTPDDPRHVDLYSDSSPPETESVKPFLYEQVLDHEGKAIAWAWRAGRYADHLIKTRTSTIKIGQRSGLRVQFPLIASHNQLRAYKYAVLVQKYARKYKVTESLIYGVIKTESSFNPFAVSKAPAYGLMQIVPSTAGRDVFEKIKERPGQPSPDYLYDPENNIDTGTAYIKILQERYLAGIDNSNAKRYSVISAYNGGAGNVMKTFSSDRRKAIDKINSLSASQVYDQLTKKHPSSESRRYLYKVNEAQKEFWSTNGFKPANGK
ncbi:MAG: membrane-bound lytic murein transglycosylase MltC [Gammaproteobacteria bacterium]|nr:membrane-bound lytic murein transglycosylase MltC [Gammaproteobacteria bacterium]